MTRLALMRFVLVAAMTPAIPAASFQRVDRADHLARQDRDVERSCRRADFAIFFDPDDGREQSVGCRGRARVRML